MKIEEVTINVKKIIMNILDIESEISDSMELIGSNSLLDSMKLVEVCLALEDLATEHDFDFDWTSATTMSKSQSMFRTVKSLSEEFSLQSESQP